MPERFDCARCEVRAYHEALDPDNAEAWRIASLLADAAPLGASAFVLEAATADWSDRDRVNLVTRLGIIQRYGRNPTD